MIQQEVDTGAESQMVSYKLLKLVSHGVAIRQGLPVEAPVFVSPYVSKEAQCGQCDERVGPLMYAAGQEVTAHHFHFMSGGIYYHEVNNNFWENEKQSLRGWIGILRPKGDIDFQRAERVKVDQIKAFCFDCREELEEGVVTGDGDGLHDMIPVCDLQKHPIHKAEYQFQIRDGQVLFSQV